MNHAKDGVQVPTSQPKAQGRTRREPVSNAAVQGAGMRKTVRTTGGKGATSYGGHKAGGMGAMGVRMAGSVR
jgi:hypothetical protein